jgi:putative transposase
MLLSFKTALIPNNRQITAFRKEGEKLKLPSAIDLHKKLVAQGKI